MTCSEYNQYKQRVAEFFEKEGLANLSTVPTCNEPYFTWSRCECCGAIAGNRYDCDGYNPQTKKVQGTYGICEDCVYFAEYGRLDDTQMWEIEHSAPNGAGTGG